MKLTIKYIRKIAKEAGEKLVYNRSTGEYQIISGFDSSVGDIPFRNESGEIELSDLQLQKLKSHV
jgi:hypothetical protein